MGKVGQDLISDKGIPNDVFCAKCGYNLRTRPAISRCPECGNEYNNCLTEKPGILCPKVTSYPVGNSIIMLICLGFWGVPAYFIINFGEFKALWLGVPFFILFIFYVRNVVVRSAEVFRYRRLLKYAERQKGDLPADLN